MAVNWAARRLSRVESERASGVEPERVSRVGTGRVLVLLGSAVLLASSGVVVFLALVFGPVLRTRYGLTGPILLGVIVFVLVVLASIVLANLLAIRAARLSSVVLRGCGTLVIGSVAAAGVLVLLLTMN